MDIQLILLDKDGNSKKTFNLPSEVTIIGRRSNCDLRIPVMSVSKRHCQLQHVGSSLKIRDLGSRNGTILNGKTIEEAPLNHGDFLKIGPCTFLVQFDGQKPTEKKELPNGATLEDVDNVNFDDIDFEDENFDGLLDDFFAEGDTAPA